MLKLHEVNLNVDVCFTILESAAKPTLNEHAKQRTCPGSGNFCLEWQVSRGNPDRIPLCLLQFHFALNICISTDIFNYKLHFCSLIF